jgi:hypothetical protein
MHDAAAIDWNEAWKNQGLQGKKNRGFRKLSRQVDRPRGVQKI